MVQQQFCTSLLLLVVVAIKSSIAGLEASGPRIVEHPENQFVGRNEPSTLNCKAEGVPPPTITWYRNGEQVVTSDDNPLSHRMLLPSGQLFFLRVMSGSAPGSTAGAAGGKTGKGGGSSDAGIYYCNATNPLSGVSVISREASLNIAVLRDEFREQPADLQVGVGDTVAFRCRPPRGDPEPRVRWTRDGQDVLVKSTGHGRLTLLQDSSLEIRAVTKDDVGAYSCVATNAAGSRESRPAWLAVVDKPTIVRGPVDVTVQENADVLFHCTTSGDPEPTTSWRKENGMIPAHRSRILDDRGLRIKKVKTSDEGVYVCRVENKFGWKEAEARLTVNAQPSFISVPRSRSVAVGRRVAFECEATGSPPPVILWKKEQNQMSTSQDNVRFSVLDDGTLVIERAQKDDTGEYVCEAQSPSGTAYAKARLDVKDSDVRPPPIIQHGPQNQTLPISSMARLQCAVTGEPAPAVRWYKNGRLLTLAESRFVLHESGTLQIGELRRTDTGWYTCKAISETGETASSAALVVETPTNHEIIFRRTPEPSTYPGPPSKPTVTDIRESSVRLAWKANPNNGASVVTAFTVEYFSPDSGEGWTVASDNVVDNSFTVRGLKPDTSYRFIVRAQNSHGLSLPSPVTAVVRTKVKESVSEPPKTVISIDNSDPGGVGGGVGLNPRVSTAGNVVLLPPDALSPTSAQLRWDLRRSGGQRSTVDGFNIKFRPVSDHERDAMLQSLDEPLGASSLRQKVVLDSRSNSDTEFSVRSLEGADIRSYVLNGLLPSTLYAVVVEPVYMMTTGESSNVVYLHTSPDVPYSAPVNVRARILENDTILLTWEQPPRHKHNGVIIGYKVYLSSNATKYHNEVWINSSAMSELYIHHLNRGVSYQIQIAAHNNIGEGPRSELLIVEPVSDMLSLPMKPWFIVAVIVCVGSAIWLAVCLIVVWLVRYRRRQKRRATEKYSNSNGRKIDAAGNQFDNAAALRKALGLVDGIYDNYTVNNSQPQTASIHSKGLFYSDLPTLQLVDVNSKDVVDSTMKTFYQTKETFQRGNSGTTSGRLSLKAAGFLQQDSSNKCSNSKDVCRTPQVQSKVDMTKGLFYGSPAVYSRQPSTGYTDVTTDSTNGVEPFYEAYIIRPNKPAAVSETASVGRRPAVEPRPHRDRVIDSMPHNSHLQQNSFRPVVKDHHYNTASNCIPRHNFHPAATGDNNSSFQFIEWPPSSTAGHNQSVTYDDEYASDLEDEEVGHWNNQTSSSNNDGHYADPSAFQSMQDDFQALQNDLQRQWSTPSPARTTTTTTAAAPFIRPDNYTLKRTAARPLVPLSVAIIAATDTSANSRDCSSDPGNCLEDRENGRQTGGVDGRDETSPGQLQRYPSDSLAVSDRITDNGYCLRDMNDIF